jgi:hypothetical protein
MDGVKEHYFDLYDVDAVRAAFARLMLAIPKQEYPRHLADVHLVEDWIRVAGSTMEALRAAADVDDDAPTDFWPP